PAATAKRRYTLSLHDALPISEPTERGPAEPLSVASPWALAPPRQKNAVLFRLSCIVSLIRVLFSSGDRGSCKLQPPKSKPKPRRSEDHTSELQSREKIVCRLL